MHRPTLAALVLACSLFAGACHTHTYYAPEAAQLPVVPTYEDRWNPHFFFGIITPDRNQVDLQHACPNGVARIENRISFLNGLVTALVGIVYAPSEQKIWCK